MTQIFSEKKNKKDQWKLCLYISGKTPRAREAYETIVSVSEKYLKNNYILTVIDILQNPDLSTKDKIIVIPTLVRHSPKPIINITGDLSNEEFIIQELKLYE